MLLPVIYKRKGEIEGKYLSPVHEQPHESASEIIWLCLRV